MVHEMRAIPPLLLFLLAACSGSANEPSAADKLPGEERAIADAEAMIAGHPERVDAGQEGEEKDKP